MHTFDTRTPIAAVLDIPAGRVRLIAADRPDTTVEVLPANAANSRDVKAAEQISVSYAEGVLRLHAAAPDHQLLGPSGTVEVTIQLPAGSSLAAKAAAAELRTVGRLADVTIEAAQGPVKLDEAATTRVTVQAGDITIGRLTGPAEITTSKGDITITEATTGEVTLRTQAGDLSVAAAASATLDAHTAYGHIHNSLTNTEGPNAPLTIKATTAYGNITARGL